MSSRGSDSGVRTVSPAGGRSEAREPRCGAFRRHARFGRASSSSGASRQIVAGSGTAIVKPPTAAENHFCAPGRRRRSAWRPLLLASRQKLSMTRPRLDHPVSADPFRQGLEAAKANALPGLILVATAVAILIAYHVLPPVTGVLNRLAEWKLRWGFAYSMCSTALFGGILPIQNRSIDVIVTLGKFGFHSSGSAIVPLKTSIYLNILLHGNDRDGWITATAGIRIGSYPDLSATGTFG